MSKDKNAERMEGEAIKHFDRLGSLSPKTKVSLGVAIACMLFVGGGIWKLAFATSDLFHEVREMHDAQASFITVAEMESWQGQLKYNFTSVGAPLANAVPSIRAVVNESRKN